MHELVREGSTATVSHLRTRKLSQGHISILGGRGRMLRYEFRSRPRPHKRQRVGGRGPEWGGGTDLEVGHRADRDKEGPTVAPAPAAALALPSKAESKGVRAGGRTFRLLPSAELLRWWVSGLG